MGIEIQYYDESHSPEEMKLRILAYGAHGSGKTSLLSTFPRPFVIDLDRGGITLRKKHIPYVAISKGAGAYEKIASTLIALKKKAPPFDKLDVETVGIDSASALSQILLDEAIRSPRGARKPKDPLAQKAEFDDWSELKNKIMGIMQYAKELPYNVVVTAGQRLDQDEATGAWLGQPLVEGGYRSIIGHDFDEVYYLATTGSGKSVKYNLYTARYQYFDAKSRLGLPAVIEDPSYEKIISHVS